MTLTLAGDRIVFSTVIGELDMAQMARYVRRRAGYDRCGTFERDRGIDHPKWYDLERGRYTNLKLLVTAMLELGYTVEIVQAGRDVRQSAAKH